MTAIIIFIVALAILGFMHTYYGSLMSIFYGWIFVSAISFGMTFLTLYILSKSDAYEGLLYDDSDSGITALGGIIIISLLIAWVAVGVKGLSWFLKRFKQP